MTRKIIVDGDWGGDEMQVCAVLRAHPEQTKIIGATCVFGNAGQGYTLCNALDVLHFIGADDVPCYPGALSPLDGLNLQGDDAWGSDGVGGIQLPRAPRRAEGLDSADFILRTLEKEPAGSVTILATGPLTNIARALQKDPETMAKAGRVVIMGGCTSPIPAADMPERRGNITPHAEFNFYMAAADADLVLSSGLPIVMIPMNCTQQLSLTPRRAQMIRNVLPAQADKAGMTVDLMRVPSALDKEKFGASPFMHDVHTAFFLLYPQVYQGRTGYIQMTTDGERRGHTEFAATEHGPITVLEKIRDPDFLFAQYVASLHRVFGGNGVDPLRHQVRPAASRPASELVPA